ncbi:MAG: 4Fe-4S binding protein [Candidatus Bipolaricaulia bacterium]
MIKYKSEFEGPWADPERMLQLPTGEWRFQRPVVKVGKCSQCGWCYLFCPTGCIEERETHFAVDLDWCKGCGICAQVCPQDAIMMVREER